MDARFRAKIMHGYDESLAGFRDTLRKGGEKALRGTLHEIGALSECGNDKMRNLCELAALGLVTAWLAADETPERSGDETEPES